MVARPFVRLHRLGVLGGGSSLTGHCLGTALALFYQRKAFGLTGTGKGETPGGYNVWGGGVVCQSGRFSPVGPQTAMHLKQTKNRAPNLICIS